VFAEVVLVLHDPGVEAVAEDMAAAFVPMVEALCVRSVEAMEALGQACSDSLEHEVVVRAHQA
jgi:hypothetical protein